MASNCVVLICHWSAEIFSRSRIGGRPFSIWPRLLRRIIDLPALDLAVAGAGIALTSSLLAAPGLADGAVQRTGGDSISARDGYYLAIGDVGAPQAKEFARWLKTLLVSAA